MDNTAKTGEQVNTGAAMRITEPSYYSFLEAEERGAEDDVAAGAAGGRKLEMEPG